MLQQLGTKVRVSMTVETDREDIRKAFYAICSLFQQDLKHSNCLLNSVFLHRLPSHPYYQVASGFAEILRPLVNRVCIDDYFMGTAAVVNEQAGWAYKPYIEV